MRCYRFAQRGAAQAMPWPPGGLDPTICKVTGRSIISRDVETRDVRRNSHSSIPLLPNDRANPVRDLHPCALPGRTHAARRRRRLAHGLAARTVERAWPLPPPVSSRVRTWGAAAPPLGRRLRVVRNGSSMCWRRWLAVLAKTRSRKNALAQTRLPSSYAGTRKPATQMACVRYSRRVPMSTRGFSRTLTPSPS